jgi:flagellar basal-body rod protein FlgB
MSWLVDPATRVLTAALDGYARREQAIASNIANVDTPNYKPARIDFESELAAAIASGTPGGEIQPNPAMHGPAAVPGTGATAATRLASIEAGSSGTATSGTATSGSVAEWVSPAVSQRVDANAVDVDAQMTTLAETQLKYSAVSRMLSGKLQMLKDVVSAR